MESRHRHLLELEGLISEVGSNISAAGSDAGGDSRGVMWYPPRPPTPPGKPQTPTLRRPTTPRRMAAGALAHGRQALLEEAAQPAKKSLAFDFQALCDIVGSKASQRFRNVAQAKHHFNHSRNDTVSRPEIDNFFAQLSLPQEYANSFWTHLIRRSDSPVEINASMFWGILGPYILPGYAEFCWPQTANLSSRGPERPSSAQRNQKKDVEHFNDMTGNKGIFGHSIAPGFQGFISASTYNEEPKAQRRRSQPIHPHPPVVLNPQSARPVHASYRPQTPVPSARSSSRPSSARSARPSSARGLRIASSGGAPGLRAARAAAAHPKARTASSLGPNCKVVSSQVAGPSRPRPAPQATPRPSSASKIQSSSWDVASLASVSTQASSTSNAVGARMDQSRPQWPWPGAGGASSGASSSERLQRAEAKLGPRGLACFIGNLPASPVHSRTFDSSNFWSQLGQQSAPAFGNGKKSRSWGPSMRQSTGEEQRRLESRKDQASPRWREEDYTRAEEKYGLNLSVPDHHAGWRIHAMDTPGDVHNEFSDHVGAVVIQPGHHERTATVYLRDNPGHDLLSRLRDPDAGLRRARSAPGSLRRVSSRGRSATMKSPRPAPEPPPSPGLSGRSDAHHDDSSSRPVSGRAVYYTDHTGQVTLDLCKSGGESVRSSINGSH